MDVAAQCSRKFRASRTSGTRPVDAILWIVLHDAEAASAEGVARYFQLPKATGSAHLVVDEDWCYRCLSNVDVPWAAPGANTAGFHIEQCGYAKWSAVIWAKHRDTLRRAAYKTALHCKAFDLPVVWREAADLRLHRPGITSHAECTKAFGGDHTDPGPFWPRRMFMRYVNEYYHALPNGV